MTSKPSVRDVLTFHNLDRTLYDQIRLTHGRNACSARNIVALWMWLELIGINVTLYLNSCLNRAIIHRFIIEAEAILDVICPGSPPPVTTKHTTIPFTANLVCEPLNLGFFHCYSDVVVKGITCILDGVGRFIFDDNLKWLLDDYRAAVVAATLEGRRELPVLHPLLAQRYQSRLGSRTEDCRTLFVAFSKGCDLSRDDIVEYFTKKWGDCIEKVLMERTPPKVLPMNARVVFKNESFIGLLLRGERLVKFPIKRNHIWARQYFPASKTLTFKRR